MGKKSLQDLTRTTTFVFNENHQLTYEEVKLSALLRIADAMEIQAANSKIIALNTVQLQKDRDWYQKRVESLAVENKHLRNSNRALRGVVTREKNKQS